MSYESNEIDTFVGGLPSTESVLWVVLPSTESTLWVVCLQLTAHCGWSAFDSERIVGGLPSLWVVCLRLRAKLVSLVIWL